MKKLNRVLLSLMLAFFVLTASSCMNTYSRKQIKYYSNEENYIEATGTITHVRFNDEKEALYLGFTDLSERFDDTTFKITKDNYSIIVNAKDSIQVGKTATFITAPKYFGDGYIMPIVSLTIDGDCLLEYEVGISNFLDELKK